MTKRFRDLSVEERMEQRGHKAEDAFRRWAPTKSIRFLSYGFDIGNDNPITRFKYLPRFVRQTPDFLCEGPKKLFFVECKGTDKGYKTISIKVNSLQSAKEWRAILSFYFFLYDSREDRCCLVTYEKIAKLCESTPISFYPIDRNEYHAIPIDTFKWEAIKGDTDA